MGCVPPCDSSAFPWTAYLDLGRPRTPGRPDPAQVLTTGNAGATLDRVGGSEGASQPRVPTGSAGSHPGLEECRPAGWPRRLRDDLATVAWRRLREMGPDLAQVRVACSGDEAVLAVLPLLPGRGYGAVGRRGPG